MVARLCYDFTTKHGAWTTSLTVSISTRSEQAGIAGEAGCTHNQRKVLFQVVRHGKDNIHGKITLRTNENIVFGCIVLTTQLVVIMPSALPPVCYVTTRT